MLINLVIFPSNTKELNIVHARRKTRQEHHGVPLNEFFQNHDGGSVTASLVGFRKNQSCHYNKVVPSSLAEQISGNTIQLFL